MKEKCFTLCKAFFLTAAKRIFSGVRILLGAALFVPILAYMVWFNYTVDSAGVFQGDQYLRDVAQLLLSGDDVVGYEQLNARERDVMKIVVLNMESAYEAIALGSSRILQLNDKIAGTESFYNCGMVGADFYDVLGTFYLFDKAGKLPENLLIGFDPWLFSAGADAVDKRSDKELYAEFLTEKLGIDTGYEKKDESEKWQELIKPSYFQGNVAYYFRDQSLVKKPSPVEGDLYFQPTEVKRYDGSLLYDIDFRSRSQEEVDFDAEYQRQSLLRMFDYEKPDKELMQVFERFLTYAKAQGVNVILILTPYHPITYDYAVAHPEIYPGFNQTEAAVRRIAAQHDVPVYGSYNPHAIEGVTTQDFYDGIHSSAACLKKIFPGLDRALENQQKGVDVSLDYKALPPDETQHASSGA